MRRGANGGVSYRHIYRDKTAVCAHQLVRKMSHLMSKSLSRSEKTMGGNSTPTVSVLYQDIMTKFV